MYDDKISTKRQENRKSRYLSHASAVISFFKLSVSTLFLPFFLLQCYLRLFHLLRDLNDREIHFDVRARQS